MTPKVKLALLASGAILCITLFVVCMLILNALSGFRVAEKIPLAQVEIAQSEGYVELRYEGRAHWASQQNFEEAKSNEPYLYRTWKTKLLTLNIEKKLNLTLGFALAGFFGAAACLAVFLFGLPKKPKNQEQSNVGVKMRMGLPIFLFVLGLAAVAMLIAAEARAKEYSQKVPLAEASLLYLSDTEVRVTASGKSDVIQVSEYQKALAADPYLYVNESGKGKVGFLEKKRQFSVSAYIAVAAIGLCELLFLVSWLRNRRKTSE